MPVTPNDILGSALSMPDSTEADLRTIASRSYYAAYHHGVVFHAGLASPGRMSPKPVGTHEDLIHRLTNPADLNKATQSRQLGYILAIAKQLRVIADYKPEQTFSPGQKEEAIGYAKRCLSIL